MSQPYAFFRRSLAPAVAIGAAVLPLSLQPLSAQLFENLERFASRIDVGDPDVPSAGREGPKSICLSDLDGDGKLDIVTGNLDGTVSLSFGEGELAFEESVHLQTGAKTLRGLICADLNEDGRPDIATAAPAEGLVHLFFNQGDRNFATPTPLKTFESARNLIDGDFDGDGHRDLAVAGREQGVVAYRGDGQGSFAVLGSAPDLYGGHDEWFVGWRPVYSMQTVSRPSSQNPALTQDWLIATHAETDQVWMLKTNLFGDLKGDAFHIGHLPHSLEAGVISRQGNDGPPNLLTADKRRGTIHIFASDPSAWNRGELDFGETIQEIHVPGAPRDLQISDLNGDGWNDLVVVLRNFNRLIIYHNNEGQLHAVTETPVGTSPRELAAGHLNDDNLEDFVVINRQSQDVSVLLASDEETGFEALDQVYPVAGEVAGLELHDLTGDGRDDVIQLHRSSGDVSVRLSGSKGQLERPRYYHMGVLPSGLELRDLDGDQHLDLLTANLGRRRHSNGEVAIRMGRPDGSFGPRAQVPTEGGARIFAIEAADFNKDGIVDFAVGYFDCRISFFEGYQDGSYKLRRTDRFTYESRVMVTGDFDQDGDTDIAGAGYAGDVVVLVNEGDILTTSTQKRFDYPPQQESKFGTREIRALDINDDGDLDLMVGSGKGVMALLGSTGASFEPQKEPLKGAAFPASSMAEGDMDGDGIADLAVSCRILACVTILKGGDDGEFLPAVTVDVPAGEFVRVGDVDGDGQTDLVGSGDALWVALSSRSPEAGPPTTWKPQRPALPQVVINEILPSNSRYRFEHTPTETPDAIELYNGASQDMNLKNWTLERIQKLEDGKTESKEFEFPDFTIATNDRLVLYASKRDHKSPYHTGFKLPADGATLILRDDDGIEVDRVEYPPMEADLSFSRYQDGVQAFRHNLFPDIGSANIDNGELEPTLFFDGFDFEKLGPNQPLKVTARANDDVGVIALNVVYRPIGQPEVLPAHTVLYDDGMHGDGGMLDGLFAGELPGLPQGSEIQFFVEATDLNNKTTYLPNDPIFATTREQLRNVYTLGLTEGISGLEISEVVTDNETIEVLRNHSEGENNTYGLDYAELRNFGTEPIDLAGLMLARSFAAQDGSLFTFPFGQSTLAPGESIVVNFSDWPQSNFDAPFTLRKNGETVFLLGESPLGARTVLDYVKTPVLGDDEAFFRAGPDGEWMRGTATPGQPNLVFVAPELTLLDSQEEPLLLRFSTVAGESYVLESSPTLEPGSWTPIAEGDGHGFSQSVRTSSESKAMFYRVRQP